MKIAIGSIFRNSSSYLDRYVSQVKELDYLVSEGHLLFPILVEGDSTDDTWERLTRLAGRSKVIKREHGGKWYSSGSEGTEERWRGISYACDGVLEAVELDVDIFIYVESDLIWEPETMMKLVGPVRDLGPSVLVPMCFYGPQPTVFYDTYGFWKDGVQFTNEAPYHPSLADWRGGFQEFVEVDSAGSCLVMRGDVARNCRFDPPEKGIVGFCENIRANDYRIWLDPAEAVIHPKLENK